MAGKTLAKLKLVELKQELEERDLETRGSKADLQLRLADALRGEGHDPENFIFENDGDRVLRAISELAENSRTLEEKLTENSITLKEELLETYKTLKEELAENSKTLKEELTETYRTLKKEFSNNLSDVEKKMQTLQERIVQLETQRSGAEETKTPAEILVPAKNEAPVPRAKFDAPVFDGKVSSWDSYVRQFEAAARAYSWNPSEKALALVLALRGEALEVLQTMPLEEQDNYEKIIGHLETRYGSVHLRQVHHIELKNRLQKSEESLQVYEMDIARLARRAYPTLPNNVLEELAQEAFIDGLRDSDTKQALRLRKPKTLVDALAQALEFEAVKKASKSESRVREMKTEQFLDLEHLETLVEAVLRKIGNKRSRPRCWNCGEIGHLRGRCGKPQSNQQPSEN